MSISLLLGGMAATSFVGGCQPGGKTGTSVQRVALTGADAEAQTALIAEGDAAFALRIDRAQLELSIAKWSEAVAKKPDDYQTLEKLARAYYLLADGHLMFERATKEKEFLAAYENGYNSALKGLQSLSPEFEKKLKLGIDIGDASGVIGKDGAGLLYWYATNLGKWGNAHDDMMVVLKYKDRLFKVMTRVTSVDPTFFYGATDRYWGSYYAIAPSFAGGDLDKSWKHFEASVKAAPNYVGTYTLIAEFYATKRLNQAMFMEYTQKVLDAAPDVLPGFESETAVEKKKVELLRKRLADGDIVF